jgi:hypothetical protein
MEKLEANKNDKGNITKLYLAGAKYLPVPYLTCHIFHNIWKFLSDIKYTDLEFFQIPLNEIERVS